MAHDPDRALAEQRLQDIVEHIELLAADPDTQNAWLHPCGWTRQEPYEHVEVHPPCAPIDELVDGFDDMWPSWREVLGPVLTPDLEQALDRLASLLGTLDEDAYRDGIATLDRQPWAAVRQLSAETLLTLPPRRSPRPRLSGADGRIPARPWTPAVLYLTPEASPTSQALAEAAHRRGLHVATQRSAAEKAAAGCAYLYGGPAFAQRAAKELSVALLEPEDDWLTRLRPEHRRRDIRLMTVAEARYLPGRWFIKTPREKTSFQAGVYTAGELPILNPDELVLISDIVTFTVEYRLFLLDGRVHTASRYLTSGHPDSVNLDRDTQREAVLDFAADLLTVEEGALPSAVTLDVGWAVNADTGDEGWAVVEANMPWFSNIYEADPVLALDVIMRSAGPQSSLADRDHRFVR